jgi:hypothetical protein
MSSMDRVSEEAGRATLEDLDGRKLELRETWAARTVVLAFVRHFG